MAWICKIGEDETVVIQQLTYVNYIVRHLIYLYLTAGVFKAISPWLLQQPFGTPRNEEYSTIHCLSASVKYLLYHLITYFSCRYQLIVYPFKAFYLFSKQTTSQLGC